MNGPPIIIYGGQNNPQQNNRPSRRRKNRADKRAESEKKKKDDAKKKKQALTWRVFWAIFVIALPLIGILATAVMYGWGLAMVKTLELAAYVLRLVVN